METTVITDAKARFRSYQCHKVVELIEYLEAVKEKGEEPTLVLFLPHDLTITIGRNEDETALAWFIRLSKVFGGLPSFVKAWFDALCHEAVKAVTRRPAGPVEIWHDGKIFIVPVADWKEDMSPHELVKYESQLSLVSGELPKDWYGPVPSGTLQN